MAASLCRVGVFWVVMLASCRDAGARVFPDTPLGRVGRDWLAAHNRAEGHAAVHFTMQNRGLAPVTGAQTDSMVSASVRLARTIGPLVPVRVLYATDTALAVLLRSADTASIVWTARFHSAPQPALVDVLVEVNRQ